MTTVMIVHSTCGSRVCTFMIARRVNVVFTITNKSFLPMHIISF